MNLFGSIAQSTLLLIILSCALFVHAEVVQIVTPENTSTVTEESKITTTVPSDSYLTAYLEAQKLRSAPAKRNDYYDSPEKETQGGYNTVIRSSHLTSYKYPSLSTEWVPMHPVSPPPAAYGPPQMSYGSPYAHHHNADLMPTTHSCNPIPYSAPSNLYLGLLPKKISLKIILKILLKLILFKMIVKFIAVICLLLFIPVLKSKEMTTQDDADEGKKAKAIDMMSDIIWNSIDSKNSLYDKDEETDDIKDIAEEMDDDDEDEEKNAFAS